MCSEANVTNGIKTDKTVDSEEVNDTVDGNKDESNDTDTSGTPGMDRQPIPMKHPKVKQQNSGEKKKRKKRKKKKSNSITIENEASQTSRDGSAPKEVLKSSAPKEVLKSSAPKEVLKSSAPKEVLKSSAPKEVLKSSAPKEVLKSLAPKEVLKSLAPKEDLKSSAPKEDLKSSVIKEKMNLQCQDKPFEKFEQKNEIKTDLNENCEIPFNTCEHNVEGTDQINSFIRDQMGTTIICHVETAESEISIERTASQIAALEEFSCLESRENENLLKHIHRDDLNDKQQLTNGKEVSDKQQSTNDNEVNDKLDKLQQSTNENEAYYKLQSTNGDEVNDKIQQSTNGDEVNDKVQQSTNGDEVNDKVQQSTNGDEVNDTVQQSTNGDEVNDKVQQSTNGDEVNDKAQQSTNGDEVNDKAQQSTGDEVNDKVQQSTNGDEVNDKVQQSTNGDEVNDKVQQSTNGDEVNDKVQQSTNGDEVNDKLQQSTNGDEVNDKVQQSTNGDEVNDKLQQSTNGDEVNDKLQQSTNGDEVNDKVQQSTNGDEVNEKVQQSTNGDEVNDTVQQSTNGDEVNDKVQQTTNGDEVNDKVQQSTNGDEVNDKLQQPTNGDEVKDKVQQSTNGDEVNNTLQQMMNADQLRHAIHSDKINVKVNVTSTGNYFDGHGNQEETTTLKNGVHSNDIQSPTTNIDERNGKQWKAAHNVKEKKKKGKPLNELAETWHIMHPHTLILDESRQRLTEMYLLRQVMDKEVPANTNMDREKMPNTCNSVTLIKGDKTVHDNSELHKCNDLIDTDDIVTCKYDQIQEEKSVSHNSNTTVVDNDLNADPVFGEKQNKDIDEAEEKSNVGSSLAEDSQRTTYMQVDSILISPTRASSQLTKGPGNSMSESQLLVQLQEQHIAMTKLQAYAQEQKVESNLLTTALRRKLRQKETKLKSVQAQYEQQMMSVLSRLLFLEGHLQREHKQMSEILQEKDDIIRRQKAAITDLTEKNDGLLKALKESHGYSEDNGLIKLENIVVNQNGSIPIQDHGNKVILRAPKSKNGEKTPSKVRFSAMKERLRRHKSSLELYHGDRLETLDEGGLRYGSQENLVTKNDVRNFDRKERCRSLVDYPYGLRDVDEHHNESPDSCFGDSTEGFPNDSKNSSSSSLVNISERLATMSGKPSSKSMPSYGFNELSKSRSVPHALPTVAENDTGNTNLKERPLSLPSVELLVKDVQPSSNSSSTTGLNNVGQPAPSPSNASPPSESNPFKSFKNVFKRRGSKKKKSPIAENQESNSEALKQHFKKFNLS